MGNREDEREDSEVIITVNSQIKSTIDYDKQGNVFIVNGTFTEPDDVGVWTVRVKLVYYEKVDQLVNVTLGENEIVPIEETRKTIQVYQMSFNLEIIANESIEETKEDEEFEWIKPEPNRPI